MAKLPPGLRARINAPPGLPLVEARKFLAAHWNDADGLAEIRNGLEGEIAVNPKYVIRGLDAIERLLEGASPPGTLRDLVLWSANQPLGQPSDEAARAWLEETASFVRDVLGDKQPGPPLVTAREFLDEYWAGEEDPDVIRTDLAETVTFDAESVARGIEAIASLLDNPPAPGVLATLVARHARHPLDPATDEGARVWLREAAGLARSVLENEQPATELALVTP